MTSLAQFNEDNLLATVCIFDDLVKLLFTHSGPGRKPTLTLSELATISLIKSHYGIHELKQVYRLLSDRFSNEFKLPCYKNFVTLMNQSTFELLILIDILLCFRNKSAGVIKLIDSTALPVCKNIRIPTHKVMKRIATRSKTTTGHYYGLKLHALTDETGNLVAFQFTTANVDERKILDKFLDMLSQSIIVADAGYISKKLEKKAQQRGNIFITGARNTMKKLASMFQIDLLNIRINIEHLFSTLKERFRLVTSLPRSELGYLAHYIRTIFGYLYLSGIS